MRSSLIHDISLTVALALLSILFCAIGARAQIQQLLLSGKID